MLEDVSPPAEEQQWGEGSLLSGEIAGEVARAVAVTPRSRSVRSALSRRLSTPGWVFWLLFGINAVNYLDRLLVVAVGPTIKAQFHLSDRAIGLLSSAFLLLYTLATLPIGVLADRFRRARIVALGVGLWSLMSGATAFVGSFGGLVVTRVFVGVGEASYFPAGTALLSAYHPLERRARVMSRWGVGQLVGSALAFGMSALLYALLNGALAWRVAFLLSAVPGLIFAVLIWFVGEAPGEAPSEEESGASLAAASAPPAPLPPSAARISLALGALVRQARTALAIPTVRLGIVLQAVVYIVVTPTVTFLPIYLRSANRPFALSAAQVSAVSGALLIVGGTVGVLLGGEVAGWLSRRWASGRVLAIAAGFGCAVPCYILMLTTHALAVFLVAGTLAVLALNIPAGPLGAATQDATPPALRASAVATALLAAHLLGDAWAPGAVGALSTALGERTGTALLCVGVPALVLGCVLSLRYAHVYVRDLAAREAEARAV